MHILIVEDDPITQMYLKAVLEAYGICDVVGDGAEAVRAYIGAAAKGNFVDVVFIDIMLPKMDGLTAIDRIREHEAHHPHSISHPAQVVMVTALEGPQDIIHAYCSGGAFAYLKKPLLREEVDATMQKIINGYSVAL